MADVRRPEFPDTFTEHNVGDPWQRPQPAIVRAIMQQFTGPNCIGGVAVDYRRIKVDLRARDVWPRVKATLSPADKGPAVSPVFRRTWRMAACLGIAMNSLAQVEAAHGKEAIRHGIVRITRAGDVVAGLLPQAVSFGTYVPYSEQDETMEHSGHRTVLYRTGRFYDVAVPAIYLLEKGRLLTPIKTAVLEENVPVDRATPWTHIYGTPIV